MLGGAGGCLIVSYKVHYKHQKLASMNLLFMGVPAHLLVAIMFFL